MTRRLLLTEFIAAFGENPGVLPDGLVAGSSGADWPRLLHVIDESNWDATWSDTGRVVAVGDLDEPSPDRASFALRPTAGIQINFFPDADEILFDIDLREVTSQDALDALSTVIVRLGSSFDTPVTLSTEGKVDEVAIRYDPASGESSAAEPRGR